MVFFFNDTATTEIYTLSLHDALPISDADMAALGLERRHVAVGPRQQTREPRPARRGLRRIIGDDEQRAQVDHAVGDRKSTRLNSSHGYISYAVFCFKKKIHRKTSSGL